MLNKNKIKIVVFFLIITCYLFPPIVKAEINASEILQIDIPGVELSEPEPESLRMTTTASATGESQEATSQIFLIPWIAEYTIGVYNYAVRLLAIFATVMVVIGGFLYLTSAGLPDRITKAKSIIFGALSGLVLILGSHLMLSLINPNLVSLQAIRIEKIKRIDIADTEETKNCAKFANNPEAIGSDMSLFVQVQGRWLQKPAAEDFERWMNDLAGQGLSRPSLNSAFRSSANQKCLRETKPELAAPACRSNHEHGLAVDLGVKAFEFEDYKKILTAGKNRNFINYYSSWSSDPNSVPENWKEKIEVWHFDYKGGNVVRDFCRTNPSAEAGCCKDPSKQVHEGDCMGIDNGEECPMPLNGYCYQGLCYNGNDGDHGDPCGTGDQIGICNKRTDDYWNRCPDFSIIVTGGRGCKGNNQVCCMEIKDHSECVGKGLGDRCGNGQGWCYAGKCYTEKGSPNEPCGDEAGAKCYRGGCPSELTSDWGGRDCKSGSNCCRPPR